MAPKAIPTQPEETETPEERKARLSSATNVVPGKEAGRFPLAPMNPEEAAGQRRNLESRGRVPGTNMRVRSPLTTKLETDELGNVTETTGLQNPFSLDTTVNSSTAPVPGAAVPAGAQALGFTTPQPTTPGPDDFTQAQLDAQKAKELAGLGFKATPTKVPSGIEKAATDVTRATINASPSTVPPQPIYDPTANLPPYAAPAEALAPEKPEDSMTSTLASPESNVPVPKNPYDVKPGQETNAKDIQAWADQSGLDQETKWMVARGAENQVDARQFKRADGTFDTLAFKHKLRQNAPEFAGEEFAAFRKGDKEGYQDYLRAHHAWAKLETEQRLSKKPWNVKGVDNALKGIKDVNDATLSRYEKVRAAEDAEYLNDMDRKGELATDERKAWADHLAGLRAIEMETQKANFAAIAAKKKATVDFQIEQMKSREQGRTLERNQGVQSKTELEKTGVVTSSNERVAAADRQERITAGDKDRAGRETVARITAKIDDGKPLTGAEEIAFFQEQNLIEEEIAAEKDLKKKDALLARAIELENRRLKFQKKPSAVPEKK